MKNRKWYSISKTFVIVLIAVVISYSLIPGYIWLKWNSGGIFAFLVRPVAPHSVSYLDSDFTVLLSPVHRGSIPLGKVIFYKVLQSGDVKRVYEIKHCGPEIERPTEVGDTFYFPHGSALFHKSVTYITVLRNGKVYRKDIGCSTSENIVYLNEKLFVLTTCEKQLYAFDKNMNLLKKSDLSKVIPEEFVAFYLYRYKNSLWIMGNDKDYGDKNFYRIFVKINPETLSPVKIVRFPYPLAPDGDHGKIIKYDGKIYVLGNDDENWLPYKCMHDVIYVLDPLPKPVYVSSYVYYLVNNSKPDKNFSSCLKKYESQKFKFGGACQFIPVDPDKKDFIITGQSGDKFFLYFSRTNKFTEIPKKFYEKDIFDFNPGVFCKGHIYIATPKYLLKFKNGKFEIVDRYRGNFDAPFISRTKDLEN